MIIVGIRTILSSTCLLATLTSATQRPDDLCAGMSAEQSGTGAWTGVIDADKELDQHRREDPATRRTDVGQSETPGSLATPAKRKAVSPPLAPSSPIALSSSSSSSLLLPTTQHVADHADAGPHEAHRAYIARNAPHLLNREPDAGTHGAQGSLAATAKSESARYATTSKSSSPTPSSSRPSPSPSDEGFERASHTRGRETPTSTKPRSHHTVPRGYLGPLPLIGDAEDIAPAPPLMPALGTTSEMCNVVNYPINRNGWRYTAAGPATQLLPYGVYRSLETEPRGVHWSWSDRSPYTHISPDSSGVSANGGFRSARANIPVRQGSWYAEVHILPPEPAAARECSSEAHVRIGWGRREASLNAPVGCNGYSYGIRDTSGEKVFLSRTYDYGRPFGIGDVIGMWITLPPERSCNAEDRLDPARIQRKRLPIRYKGRLYFESLEYASTKEMEHLMDRSRRGEKLADARGPAETVFNPSNGLLSLAGSGSPGAEGQQKKRKAAGPAPGSAPATSATSNLRLLSTLGPESMMGFFVNGEPQGIAFDNLLDFRPLRRQKAGKGSMPGKTKKASAGSLGSTTGDTDDDVADVITASSTAASILKSRENHFDDGSLGYFPFVSLYGGAKARLVTQAENFRYPPPDNVGEVLADVDRQRRRAPLHCDAASPVFCTPARALGERYDEYMDEMLRYDVADEEVWRALVLKRQAEEDVESRNASTDAHTPGRATPSGGSKKTAKKKGSSAAAAAAASAAVVNKQRSQSSTPMYDEKSPAPFPTRSSTPAQESSAHSSPTQVKAEPDDGYAHDDSGTRTAAAAAAAAAVSHVQKQMQMPKDWDEGAQGEERLDGPSSDGATRTGEKSGDSAGMEAHAVPASDGDAMQLDHERT